MHSTMHYQTVCSCPPTAWVCCRDCKPRQARLINCLKITALNLSFRTVCHTNIVHLSYRIAKGNEDTSNHMLGLT